MRNSVYSKKFLHLWIAERLEEGIDTEQLGFDSIIRSTYHSDLGNKIMILEPHILNSVAPAISKQQISHQVCNLLSFPLWQHQPFNC